MPPAPCPQVRANDTGGEWQNVGPREDDVLMEPREGLKWLFTIEGVVGV